MSKDVSRAAPHVHAGEPIVGHHLMSLIRFRLGAHHLRVCTGRWDGTPREDRLCTKCDLRQIEDERHVVLECPCYASIRDEYASLFLTSDNSMVTLFNHPNQSKVASLVFALEQRHAQLCVVHKS